MDISDINQNKKSKTTNNRNPLNPEYIIKSNLKNEYIKIGEIPKNKTKILHRDLHLPEPNHNLNTLDIEGSQILTSGNRWF